LHTHHSHICLISNSYSQWNVVERFLVESCLAAGFCNSPTKHGIIHDVNTFYISYSGETLQEICLITGLDC